MYKFFKDAKISVFIEQVMHNEKKQIHINSLIKKSLRGDKKHHYCLFLHSIYPLRCIFFFFNLLFFLHIADTWCYGLRPLSDHENTQLKKKIVYLNQSPTDEGVGFFTG